MSEQSSMQPNEKSWFAKHKILTGLLVLFVLGILGSLLGDEPSSTTQTKAIAQNTPEQTQPEPEYIEVTAAQLFADYEANEVAADAKYQDAAIKVTGTIGDIGKDILDTPYVTLTTENSFLNVQCMFDKADASALVDLQKNQRITLTGEVSGKLGNLLIKDCRIAEQD